MRNLVSQSPPAMFDRYLRGLTGHVAHPSRSIRISIFLALLMPVRLAPGDDLAISIPIQLTR